MSIAAQALLKDWTKEQWEKAIEGMKAQPSFFHGMDFGDQDKTYLSSTIPLNYKKGEKLELSGQKGTYTIIELVNKVCVEIGRFKRKSKGWRKHIRRMKCTPAS